MNKTIVGLISLIFMTSLAFAVGFHSASEITPGTFTGDYNFKDGYLTIDSRFNNPTQRALLINTSTRQLTDTVFEITGFSNSYGPFVMKNNGNIGIGTTTPQAKLDVNGTIKAGGIVIGPETTRTINVDNTMSAAEIQAEIDKIGKYIPEGQTITFQFADGTYTLDQSLEFSGFFGGGNLYIQGNTGEIANLHTDQAVILDFSSGNRHGIRLNGNSITTVVWYLRIKIKSDTSTYAAIDAERNPSPIAVYYSYFEGTSTAGGIGVHANNNYVFMQLNYFSNTLHGIYCNYQKAFSRQNAHAGTMPAYGLTAANGCEIVKFDASQPSGSSAGENPVFAGIIR